MVKFVSTPIVSFFPNSQSIHQNIQCLQIPMRLHCFVSTMLKFRQNGTKINHLNAIFSVAMLVFLLSFAYVGQ